MSEPFLSSDDYDERAHQLYNEAQYDAAIETLRDGLGLYPHAVELHVGMGYARLAREEYLWARHAFEEAVGLDPEHEDALAGLGEVLLKFGDRAGAVACFDRMLALGFRDDHDLMLQVGRALFREGVLDQARRFFEVAITGHPDSAEAAACVGYASHRLADEGGALYWLRRALELDLEHTEARVYLANLLYDRGEYEAALFHLERTAPADHFDGLAIWRLIELKNGSDIQRASREGCAMIRRPGRLHKRRTPTIFSADALRPRGHPERLRHLAARLHRRGRARRPQGRRRGGRRAARQRDELRHGGRVHEECTARRTCSLRRRPVGRAAGPDACGRDERAGRERVHRRARARRSASDGTGR